MAIGWHKDQYLEPKSTVAVYQCLEGSDDLDTVLFESKTFVLQRTRGMLLTI